MLDFILDFVCFLNDNNFYISEDKTKRFIKSFYELDIEDYKQLVSLMKTSFCSCKNESAIIEDLFIDFLIKKDNYSTKNALERKEKKLKEDFEKMTFESQEEIDKINEQISEIIKILEEKEYDEKASDKNESKMAELAKKYAKKCPEIKDFLEEVKKNGESVAMLKFFKNRHRIRKEMPIN